MKKLSNIQIFKKVSKHLLTQDKKSVDRNENCMYRGAKGTSCAIGCMIPDAMYSRRMEGIGIRYLIQRPKFGPRLAQIGINEGNTQLLVELQQVHDNRGVDDWRDELIFLGKKHRFISKKADFDKFVGIKSK